MTASFYFASEAEQNILVLLAATPLALCADKSMESLYHIQVKTTAEKS
jgi:hypothetical protein